MNPKNKSLQNLEKIRKRENCEVEISDLNPVDDATVVPSANIEPLISHIGILMTFYLSIILDLQNFFH
jgi:hypothetical protein